MKNALPSFIATTRRSVPCSASVLILVGPPLGFLPSHRNDRFPRCTRKPEPSSHRFHAGCRSASRQGPAELVPGQCIPPGFDITFLFSTRHQRFTFVRLPGSHLTGSCPAFSVRTLTTMTLYHSSLRWFEASSCKPTSRDLPSSLLYFVVAHIRLQVEYGVFNSRLWVGGRSEFSW